MTHGTVINALAWIVTVASGIAFLASALGVIYCFATFNQRSAAELTAVDSYLHDTYYVIRHSRAIVWPLSLSMLLAAATMILGYIHTDMHVVRMMRHPVSGTKV